jgi:predicted kinase
MLYIFGGLPGKENPRFQPSLPVAVTRYIFGSTRLNKRFGTPGLDVNGSAGYRMGYALALENLRLGATVVADSVNPLRITREAWLDVARQAQAPFVEIEITCSDKSEHCRRIESRDVDIAELKLPGWKEVVGREYDLWDAPHLVLDTAGRTAHESILDLFGLLQKGGFYLREKT